MREFLSACLLLLAFCAKAQTDSSELEMDSISIVFVRLPDSTALGIPDGKLVSREIGPSGGKIMSDDGKVELIFPGGALTKATNISIQPVVNALLNTGGKGYQFEPSGLQFEKPVELIFHYTNEEAESCPPEFMFMALQDHMGKWEYFQYSEWDSTTSSLKSTILHFSTVINGREWELNPVEKTIRVGESFALTLNITIPPGSSTPGEDDLPPLLSQNPFPGLRLKWSVEGGQRFGTVTRQRSPSGTTAQYTAPRYVPKSDAKVLLKIDTSFIRVVRQSTRHRRGMWVGETRRPLTRNIAKFACNVTLYDDYKIVAISKWKPQSCITEWIDSTNFTVRIFSNRFEISGIQNRPPLVIKTPECKMITYLTEGCQGPVHILDGQASGYKNNGANPPRIDFYFNPVKVLILKGYATVGNFQGRTIEYNSESEFRNMHFLANGTSQEVSLSNGPVVNWLRVEPVR